MHRPRILLCYYAAAASALQHAHPRPSPRTRRRSSEQADPVLEVQRLENAIAASTEPDEQKELAEKLGMSRMSAEMSVLSANAAFYDAFQSCDVAKMKAVWSDSDDVTCVHPGHPLISGADLVLNSWRALFSSAGGMPKLEAQRQRVAGYHIGLGVFHYGTARAGKICAPNRRPAIGDQPASGGSA